MDSTMPTVKGSTPMTAREELLAIIDKAGEAAITSKANPAEGLAMVMVAGLRFLVDRIEQLEKVPLKFTGTYEIGRVYAKNELVVHHGSLWIALKENQQAPGAGDGWQLCCKRGQDGRDAR